MNKINRLTLTVPVGGKNTTTNPVLNLFCAAK